MASLTAVCHSPQLKGSRSSSGASLTSKSARCHGSSSRQVPSFMCLLPNQLPGVLCQPMGLSHALPYFTHGLGCGVPRPHLGTLVLLLAPPLLGANLRGGRCPPRVHPICCPYLLPPSASTSCHHHCLQGAGQGRRARPAAPLSPPSPP